MRAAALAPLGWPVGLRPPDPSRGGYREVVPYSLLPVPTLRGLAGLCPSLRLGGGPGPLGPSGAAPVPLPLALRASGLSRCARALGPPPGAASPVSACRPGAVAPCGAAAAACGVTARFVPRSLPWASPPALARRRPPLAPRRPPSSVGPFPASPGASSGRASGPSASGAWAPPALPSGFRWSPSSRSGLAAARPPRRALGGSPSLRPGCAGAAPAGRASSSPPGAMARLRRAFSRPRPRRWPWPASVGPSGVSARWSLCLSSCSLPFGARYGCPRRGVVAPSGLPPGRRSSGRRAIFAPRTRRQPRPELHPMFPAQVRKLHVYHRFAPVFKLQVPHPLLKPRLLPLQDGDPLRQLPNPPPVLQVDCQFLHSHTPFANSHLTSLCWTFGYIAPHIWAIAIIPLLWDNVNTSGLK